METYYKGWKIVQLPHCFLATKRETTSIQMETMEEVKIEIDNQGPITCPFCGDENFDMIGLKSHLFHGDCETYNQTINIERKF